MTIMLNTCVRSRIKIVNLTSSSIFKNFLAVKVLPMSSNAVSAKDDGLNSQASSKAFKEIFRFPYIKFGYALNKFKWAQTLVTAAALPASAAFYFGGVFNSDTLVAILISGVAITLNVYIYGSAFYQAVGFLYISEDGSTLKISYLDFWGERVNMEVPVDDVMPLSECPHSFSDRFFRTISFYSTEKPAPRLFLKFGGKITDTDKFIKVFGEHTD